MGVETGQIGRDQITLDPVDQNKQVNFYYDNYSLEGLEEMMYFIGTL